MRIVGLASWLLPKRSRADHRDEWIDHVLSSGEVGVCPMLSAIAIAAVAAPYFAIAERLGELGGFGFLDRIDSVAQRIARVEPFPPISRLEYLSRVDLMRVSTEELLEICRAIQAARRRGKPIPISLIYELASIPMSYRFHSLRGCKMKRRPVYLRIVSRIKFYVELWRSAAESTSDSQTER